MTLPKQCENSIVEAMKVYYGQDINLKKLPEKNKISKINNNNLYIFDKSKLIIYLHSRGTYITSPECAVNTAPLMSFICAVTPGQINKNPLT